MKYLISLLLSILSFCTGFAQDGWIMRKSGTTNRLNSIASIDGQNVLAVGENLTIINSNTAGISWQTQQGITWKKKSNLDPQSLSGVTAISGKIFCVVGMLDSIFRTTDGGFTWKGYRSKAFGDCVFYTSAPVKTGTARLFAIDYDTLTSLCVAVGSDVETVFSRDSGKHWTERLQTRYFDLGCVSAYNGGVLSGAEGYGQTFFSQTQGRRWVNSWIGKNISINGCDVQGWTIVGSGGAIYHSPSHGLGWDSIPGITQFNLNAVHFGNVVRGYAVGDHGTILMTTDGGYTWVQQHCPTTQNLRSVHMSDPFHGFICGDSGVILTTQNGGYYDDSVDPLPESASGIRAYPNPFTSRTVIEVSIPHPGSVRLSIFNMLGEEVAVLANGVYESGLKTFEWNAGNAPSGVYLCKLEIDGQVITSQITLEK